MTNRNMRIALPNNDVQSSSQYGIANVVSQEINNWDPVSANAVQGDVKCEELNF